MKFLMLTWNYPPVVGGIEQVAQYTATGLRGRGHTVRVVASALPPGAQKTDDSTRHLYRARKKGIPAFLWHAFFTGLRLIRQEKLDAILCPSLTSGPAAWLISQWTRVPYAIQIHGSDVLVSNRLYQWVITPLLSGARMLFANSQNTADLLIRRGLHRTKIRVVSPGVTPPPPLEATSTDSTIQLLAEIKGRPILLTVGRLIRRKGILEFIEQVIPLLSVRIPDLIYLIVGGEPRASLIHRERILEELTLAIQNGGHENRVKWLGRLSDADLKLVYQQADLFVLPCLDTPKDVEGFGIVILEAALHGVPCVATRCGGLPDAVADGKTGLLVEPGRFSEMADALCELLGQPDRLAALGAAARQRTLAEFTWDAVAARYEAGLQSMLESGSR